MVEEMQLKDAKDLDKALALRVKDIRKRRGYTQESLADASGVSYGSIKRFETTGMISLISLTKIAIILDCTDQIVDMFDNIEYRSIQEVINENK